MYAVTEYILVGKYVSISTYMERDALTAFIQSEPQRRNHESIAPKILANDQRYLHIEPIDPREDSCTDCLNKPNSWRRETGVSKGDQNQQLSALSVATCMPMVFKFSHLDCISLKYVQNLPNLLSEHCSDEEKL